MMRTIPTPAATIIAFAFIAATHRAITVAARTQASA